MTAIIKRNVKRRAITQPAQRSINDYRKDVEYLATSERLLTDRYPDEWVAIYDGRVIAHSTTAKDAIHQVENLGVLSNAVVLQFLSQEPKALIL